MLRTTLGQLLLNHQLPPDLRDHSRVFDKSGVKRLFQTIAETRPELYAEIAKKMTDVGRDVAYSSGGMSFGLADMRVAKATKVARAMIDSEIEQIRSDSSLSDEDRNKRIILAVGRHQKPLEDSIYAESLAERNPLALQIQSGTRGGPTNLKSLRGGDLLYTDHRDEVIPLPVLSAYSEGLRPSEYFAGAFGARKGVVDTKRATADAGFYSKQMLGVTHRLVVTGSDADTEPTTIRGLPVDTDDADNEGALLAHPVAGYPRNTILTPRVLKDLKSKGADSILVRSPTVGGPPIGGVYARDVGVRERGGLPPLGDFVGIAGSQALAEKLSQSQLSSKHTGGVAGASAGVSGFRYINALTQVPKVFPGGSVHAQADGRVAKITAAPQGGFSVSVNGVDHYVPVDRPLRVQVGDDVEAGDSLSEGIPNPAEIVKYKGIGEGRRHFISAFRDAYKNTGMFGHRRNIELLSRGLIDHVRLTEESGDHVEGDIVPYQGLEHTYEPRPDAARVAPDSAMGHYLEVPVLHYTIGSRVRPRMVAELKKHGVTSIDVHPEPPPFEPVMIRGMASLEHDQDFLTRHLGSNLEKSTLQAVHRGGSSDSAGTSFVPALIDSANFGRHGLTKGWDSTPKF